jgi:hypothetical protein
MFIRGSNRVRNGFGSTPWKVSQIFRKYSHKIFQMVGNTIPNILSLLKKGSVRFLKGLMNVHLFFSIPRKNLASTHIVKRVSNRFRFGFHLNRICDLTAL